MKILLLLMSLLLFHTVSHAQHACTATSCPLPDENIDSIRIEMTKQIKLNEARFMNSDLKPVLIKVENNRYGYQIYAEGKMILEEKSIPAIPSEDGFINEEEAMKVARFAIAKIKSGEMPPSISTEDLRIMNITY